MTFLPDATFTPPGHPHRGLPPLSLDPLYERFAADLKALGRPFPRVLDLASGPGALAGHVLREVPGLRLVALNFSEAPLDRARRRLAHKVGRLTVVTRNFAEPGWADGLGRFDAVISHDAVHALVHKRRAAALYGQLRSLLLPGGFGLLSDREASDDDDASFMTFDEHQHAFEEAGWASVKPPRHLCGFLLVRAHP